jgi:hypothetical protein
MTPTVKVWMAAVGCGILLAMVGGCGATTSDNIVYLEAQLNFQKSTCGERLSFYRIGGDGSIAGPKDAMGNFTIPAGQSLIVTDIHIAITNSTANSVQQGVSFYNMSNNNGEVVIWSAVAIAAPQSVGYYDRSLTTGIRIQAPAQLCTAISQPAYSPAILVTGYLQSP